MATVAYVGLLAVSAYATYESVQSSKEATAAQRKSIKIQQKQADEQTYRERLARIREARIRRGQIEASAAATGAIESSGYAGAVSSVQSQLGANLSFLDKIQGLSQQASIFEMQAATAKGRSATYGAYAQLAQQGASFSADWQRTFGKPKGSTP